MLEIPNYFSIFLPKYIKNVKNIIIIGKDSVNDFIPFKNYKKENFKFHVIDLSNESSNFIENDIHFNYVKIFKEFYDFFGKFNEKDTLIISYCYIYENKLIENNIYNFINNKFNNFVISNLVTNNCIFNDTSKIYIFKSSKLLEPKNIYLKLDTDENEIKKYISKVIIDNDSEYLYPIMNFSIKKLDDMLIGSEDHTCDIINNQIILTGGFQCGLFKTMCPRELIKFVNPKTSFERGFVKNIYGYDLEKNKWTDYGNLNIKPRQGNFSIVLGNKLYLWGGYSYQPLSEEELRYYDKNKISLPSKEKIYTYSDGLCLYFDDNKLVQKNINNLPVFSCNSSVVNDIENKKIYFFGGCYYDSYGFDTSKISFNIEIGKLFYSLSYDENCNLIDESFTICEEFPGTSRHQSNLFKLDDYIYLIGGTASIKKINKEKGYPEYTSANVIDNWKFSLKLKKWIRISNTITPICNFKGINYNNKKIIFFGGIRYNISVIDNDIFDTWKIINKDYEKKFNGISTIENKYTNKDSQSSSYNYYFSNMILIYDIELDKFFISNYTLPANINIPLCCSDKNNVYICGGELNPSLINNVYYGNNSSLFLKLKIKELL